jgi:DNA-binding NarL/FixJ family response regulator
MDQSKSSVVRLCAVEEQQIYREVYRVIFPLRPPIELLDVLPFTDIEGLKQTVSKCVPDVLLLGIKSLSEATALELEKIRLELPNMGIVLYLVFSNSQDIEMLRRLALKGNGGLALFMKQSLDQIERLCGAIPAVSQGQISIDMPLANFGPPRKPEHTFLKRLTTREMEILSLLAQGHTNATIAHEMFIDIKTVERHLNSMYGKLKEQYPEFGERQPRVSAARLFLETVDYLAWDRDWLVPGVSNPRLF